MVLQIQRRAAQEPRAVNVVISTPEKRENLSDRSATPNKEHKPRRAQKKERLCHTTTETVEFRKPHHRDAGIPVSI